MMSGRPLDELAAALRRLHRSAGEPSTHEIGKRIGYSHTTVAQAFKGTRCPTWPVLEVLVTYLGGDPAEFKSYWIATRDAEDPLPGTHPAPITLSYGSELSTDAIDSDNDPRSDANGSAQRLVLRWKNELETIEFFDERLAMHWIKTRMQTDETDG